VFASLPYDPEKKVLLANIDEYKVDSNPFSVNLLSGKTLCSFKILPCPTLTFFTYIKTNISGVCKFTQQLWTRR
jgi:hypothetical protein